MAYLDKHPPKHRQFKARYTTASGVIVIHTAEIAPDVWGEDGAAESVANFIRHRSDPGSYHRLCDSDSIVDLVRFDQQAYGDGTGTNPHAIHISAATQAAKWNQLPKDRLEAMVRNMARAAHEASDYIYRLHGVRIPARRVTRAESSNRVEGFISHGERDPGRRTDPGKDFPWDLLFRIYRALEAGKPTEPTTTPPKKENEMTPQQEKKLDRAIELSVRNNVRGNVNTRLMLRIANELNIKLDDLADEISACNAQDKAAQK